MEDRDDDREQGQRDHDEQECQVAEARIAARRRRRHADRHVAEHARDADQAEDRQDTPERAADQDQQQQRTDRVGGDPLAGEGEPEQHAHDRHRQPERRSALPPARPDGREDRVGGDDEQPDVDVVHADPGLDEEHPVGDHEQADERGHEAAPEEDPRQQVEQGSGQGAGDDARQPPGEGVRPGVDRGHRAGVVEDQDLLPVGGGVVGVEIGAPGAGREPVGQTGVGVGGVAVRLDDIDRPRSSGGGHARREAEDVDHLAGRVIGDPGAGRRQWLETRDPDPGPSGRSWPGRHRPR